MKKQMVVVFIAVTLFFISSIVSAQVVHLKTGKVVEGKIINRTPEYVEVDFNGTQIKYYSDEIDGVDEEAVSGGSSIAGVVPRLVSEEAAKEYAPSDQKDLFGKLLTNIYQSSKEAGWTSPSLAKAAAQFMKFSQENPSSVFAKDAAFLGVYCFYNKALLEGDKELALIFANEVGKVAARYPDASLEGFTVKTIHGVYPDDIFPPFKFARAYLRGLVGDTLGDFEVSAKNLDLIRSNFVLSRDIDRVFIEDVYQKLINAYHALKKLDNELSVRKEVSEKYPGLPLSQRIKEEDEERARNPFRVRKKE